LQAGYAGGAKLGSLTAGAWGQAGTSLTTDLVTRAVGTFALKGNAARGFAGTTDLGFVDVLGNAAGVGLGTFTATGTATGSLFRVDPTVPAATAFGVAFRSGAGAAAKGTVKKGGVTLAAPATDGEFHYLGLPG